MDQLIILEGLNHEQGKVHASRPITVQDGGCTAIASIAATVYAKQTSDGRGRTFEDVNGGEKPNQMRINGRKKS